MHWPAWQERFFVARMVVLPRGPILGLCSLPMAVRCLIARFLVPRLRRCVHPLARAVRDLVFHVELPRRLVVFWRWEHRLWLAGAKPIRPSLVWPVIHERSAKHFRRSSANVGKPAGFWQFDLSIPTSL